MKINHIAIWSKNIEILKEFYAKYFNAKSNDKYINSKKGFQSYFLSFENGCRLEIMKKEDINKKLDKNINFLGLAHFSISVGSKKDVLKITNKLKKDGYDVIGEPRTTGDGYFESVVLDPEGNRIEITV
ncbi:MAG: VOC family protein [Fusobacteriota bacterium]